MVKKETWTKKLSSEDARRVKLVLTDWSAAICPVCDRWSVQPPGDPAAHPLCRERVKSKGEPDNQPTLL